MGARGERRGIDAPGRDRRVIAATMRKRGVVAGAPNGWNWEQPFAAPTSASRRRSGKITPPMSGTGSGCSKTTDT